MPVDSRATCLRPGITLCSRIATLWSTAAGKSPQCEKKIHNVAHNVDSHSHIVGSDFHNVGHSVKNKSHIVDSGPPHCGKKSHTVAHSVAIDSWCVLDSWGAGPSYSGELYHVKAEAHTPLEEPSCGGG